MAKIEGGGLTPGPEPEKPMDLKKPGKTFMSLGPPENIPTNLGKLKKDYPEFYNKLMNAIITGLGMKIVQQLKEAEKKRKAASRE